MRPEATKPVKPDAPRFAIAGQSPLSSAVACALAGGGATPCIIPDDTVPKPGDWDLVIATGPLGETAAALLRLAYLRGIPSLFAAIEEDSVRIGPLVLPGSRPCQDCCAARLGTGNPHDGAPELLARRLAKEAMCVLEDLAASPLAGHIILLDPASGSESLHRIIPMPWCPVCGGAAACDPDPRPLFPSEGSAAELRNRLAGFLDPRTGIVSHLLVSGADGEPGRLPFCAVAACTPFFGYGKGLTETESMIGAFAEALEQYSAAQVPASRLLRAPLASLSEPALDPRELVLYSESQYRRPEFPFHPFDPAAPISWTRGTWLDSGDAVWLPAAAVYMSPVPLDPLLQVTSNGLGAGATFEDAALHAVLELVERDALMLTWLLTRPGCRVILDDRLEPGLADILSRIERRGACVELYLLDSAAGIPVAICAAFGDGVSWPGVTLGCGAGPGARHAVRKAILEQGQTGPYHARLAAEGRTAIPREASEVRSFLQHALYYVPPERSQAFDFLRTSGREPCLYSALAESAEVNLEACIQRLSNAGLRVAAVDVTSPDVALLPLHVVRALAPGLQPLYCGCGMERLENPRLRGLELLSPRIHPFC